MRWVWGICILLFGASAQAGEAFDLETAEIPLDPAQKVHTVTVAGAPGYTTHVRFPDDFMPQNVSCGQCQFVEPGQTAGSQVVANWMLEVQAEDRRITLRPTRRPENERPASAFETNVVVGLDGGHTVNLVVQMLNLADAGVLLAARPVVHTVVTLTLPEAQTYSGRLAEAKRDAAEDALVRVREEANAMMIARLFGQVNCRQAWGVPTRSDRTIVRLGQMCSVTHPETENKTFFVMFQVQNKSNRPLHVVSAKLEPQNIGQATVIEQEPAYHLLEHRLVLDQKTKGMAIATLDKTSDTVPASWKLTLVVGERDALEVKNIVF